MLCVANLNILLVEKGVLFTHHIIVRSGIISLLHALSFYSFFELLDLVSPYTRVGTLIVATIYLQLIQNRYMFRSFTVLQCSHQHCVQPVASDVEVVGCL